MPVLAVLLLGAGAGLAEWALFNQIVDAIVADILIAEIDQLLGDPSVSQAVGVVPLLKAAKWVLVSPLPWWAAGVITVHSVVHWRGK